MLLVRYELTITPRGDQPKFVSGPKLLIIDGLAGTRAELDQVMATFTPKSGVTLGAPNLFVAEAVLDQFAVNFTPNNQKYQVVNPHVSDYDLVKGTVTLDYQLVATDGVVSSVKIATLSGFETAEQLLNDLVHRYQGHPEAEHRALASLAQITPQATIDRYLVKNAQPLFGEIILPTRSGVRAQITSLNYDDADYIGRVSSTGTLEIKYVLKAEVFQGSETGSDHS